MIKVARLPLLLLGAVLISLAMLRLGVWQLDRADAKQLVLDQQTNRARQAAIDLADLTIEATTDLAGLRFTPVRATGRWLAERTVLIDNQVFDSRVGYRVFTPLQINKNQPVVMVDRGWVPVGDDRRILPELQTSDELQQLRGRLNVAPAEPPLWNDEFPVANGAVWQYLPLQEYALQSGLSVLPLVLELAPDWSGETEQKLKRRWQSIDDKWVGKHKAYALQWFAMAFVFLLACIIVTLRRPSASRQTESLRNDGNSDN